MTYVAKDYTRLIGMTGFREAMLTNHFTLYQGYIDAFFKNIDWNAVESRLK